MSRPFPRHYERYLQIAKDNKMSFPQGRALYVCNRIANGDWWYLTDDRASRELWKKIGNYETPEFQEKDLQRAIKRMKDFREETAKKWILHWKNGGNIRAFSYNREKTNSERRRRYKESRISY